MTGEEIWFKLESWEIKNLKPIKQKFCKSVNFCKFAEILHDESKDDWWKQNYV